MKGYLLDTSICVAIFISWNPLAPPRHYIRVGYYK